MQSDRPTVAAAALLKCPICGAPFRFTSSLTVHLMSAHALAGWTAILFTLAIDARKGGRHVA